MTMTGFPDDVFSEDNRWITICDTDYYVVDVDGQPSEEEIQDTIARGNKIQIRVAYLRPGMEDLHYMEGMLTVDPNNPCGRTTTNVRIRPGKMPWPTVT